MGRRRSPNRDKARELWEQSGGTLSNREIAAQLAEDEKVIAVWKQRDGWLKSNVVQHSEYVVQQTPKRLNQKLIRAVEQNEELTEKEKAFCLHWVKSFNATAATIAAAYDTKYPNRVGWELLQKPHIQAEIKRLKEIRNMDMLGAAEDVLALHWRIAFGDVGDFVDWGRVEVPVMSAFGPVEVEVEDPKTKQKHKVALTREVNDVRFRESTQVDTQLVSKVKIGRDGASIELRSADKSMAFLERYFTMNPMDKHKKAFDDAKLALERQKAQAGKEPPGQDDGFIEAMKAKAGEVWTDEDSGDVPV